MKTKKIVSGLVVQMLAWTQIAPALAMVPTASPSTAMLLYSNEVMEENANTLILDNDDSGGDIVLQFGNTLSEEKLYWDSVQNIFTFTDDLTVQGDLAVTGNLNLGGTTAVNAILDEDDFASDSATALATQQSIKAYVDNTVTGYSDNEKADKVGGATAGNLAGLDAEGNLTDAGVASNNLVTLDGTQTITGNKTLEGTTTLNGAVTGNGVNTDGTLSAVSNTEVASSQAIKTYVDNSAGTNSDAFTVNQDSANGTLELGNTGDGTITYENTTDSFSFNNQTLSNVADPTNNQDVTTKKYVDGLVNGLTWKEPFEHRNQLVDGTTGGLRAGGKIFIDNHTQVLDGDTITVTYNNGADGFVLTAKDAPVASNCEFASGATAGNSNNVAQSIFAAIGSCTNASAFSGQTVTEGAAVYLIYDDTGTQGNGTITLSGNGILKINMHEGRTHAELLSNETRISRAANVTYTWSEDTQAWVQITGANSIPYATTESAGLVELALDGETASGLAVQGSDSRLHDQDTDTGTDQNSFTVDLGGTQGTIQILANDSTNQYNLIINNSGMTGNLTVTGADLEKLVNMASSAIDIDAAIGSAHTQNTDTGTDSSTFRVDSATGAGYVELADNGSNYVLSITNDGITTNLTVNASDLEKLVNIASSAADIDMAVSQAHDQNTDTGTTADTFVLNSDDSTTQTTLQFGNTLNSTLAWDQSTNVFTFTDDLLVQGDLEVAGNLTLDSGVSANAILDEDNFASNSATALATQQSIKNYVDNTVTGYSDNEKADKVGGATAGNLAGLDAEGNLTDAGVASNNLVTLDGTQTITGDKTFTGTINDTNLSSGGIDFNGNATVGTSDDTLALQSDHWSIDSTGNTTGLTIDANTNAITNLDWNDLATRVKKYRVTMNDMTVQSPSADYFCDLYSGSEMQSPLTTDPHEYYFLKTRRDTLQNMSLKIKVQLPQDFVSFGEASDLSFNYKNTGANSSASAIDISVRDNANNVAWFGGAGQNLYSANWSTFAVNFSNSSFAPSAGQYIYITLTGFASQNASPYLGEITLTYIGR